MEQEEKVSKNSRKSREEALWDFPALASWGTQQLENTHGDGLQEWI